jgi:hypothetical protein
MTDRNLNMFISLTQTKIYFHQDGLFETCPAITPVSVLSPSLSYTLLSAMNIVSNITPRVARSSEKKGKFLKFEHFSDFLLTF